MQLSNPLIKGTLLLTLAGFLSRLLGFFYRIYLSNILDSKTLGIYQLIFPIYGICYTIYAAGIQTGISKIISSIHASSKPCTIIHNTNTHVDSDKHYTILSPFFTGLILSCFLSTSLSILLFNFSHHISFYILHEPLCESPLKILSLVFPFCGLSACINGYYYAIKKTSIPSITQLIEQIIRVSIVYVFSSFCIITNTNLEIAVIGLVIGEIISCVFISSNFILTNKSQKTNLQTKQASFKIYPFRKFLAYTLPLTFNKLSISLLSSIESILIPIMLIKSGTTQHSALSIYGILTGMAMSFISFPSAITNSLSVILLPTISESKAKKDETSLIQITNKTLHYTLLLGIISLSTFVFLGHDIGLLVFNNKTAGSFISILAWLCPFIYTTTTFCSILNGLGKTNLTFINSFIGTLIRILFVTIAIPLLGIKGYLLGILISSFSTYLLNYISLKKLINFKICPLKTIVKPAIICTIAGFILKYLLSNL